MDHEKLKIRYEHLLRVERMNKRFIPRLLEQEGFKREDIFKIVDAYDLQHNQAYTNKVRSTKIFNNIVGILLIPISVIVFLFSVKLGIFVLVAGIALMIRASSL